MYKLAAVTLALFSGCVFAKLPPLSDDAKAKAAEATAKTQWSDKVAAYKLCLAMDRTAQAYQRDMKAAGKPAPAPGQTAPCADPGPYVAATPVTPIANKPLEASGAHSPPGTATSPPSVNVPAAELQPKK